MGNHLACMSPAAALKRLRLQSPPACSHNLIKFLHFETGAVSELEGPLTAAEVMMEFPAHFVCCFSSCVSSKRRIYAVPADEELWTAELYLLLPMHKLNMRFSADDMALLFVTLEAAMNSCRGRIPQSKVTPLLAEASGMKSSVADSVEGRSMRSLSFKQMEAPMSMEPRSLYMLGAANSRMFRSKSWIPKLETITESATTS